MLKDTRFKKGRKPLIHKVSCQCFRCGGVSWNKGKKMSVEHCNKLRDAHKGQKPSKQALEKLKEYLKNRVYTRGWKCSTETLRKMSMAHQGKNAGSSNKLWKGGITPIYKKIRKSLEYRLWREAVFKRDGYKCVIGGKEHGNKLQADHIKRFADYPELRFELLNGRTLCIDCHVKTDTYGGNR